MINNKIKKIILYIVTKSELGGSQKYIIDLAVGLSEKYRVGVVSGCNSPENKFREILTNNKISYFCIDSLTRSISPINDIKTIIKLVKIIRKIDPDIVHLNSSKTSILGSIACSITKTKVVYTAHGWIFNEPIPKWQIALYKLAQKRTVKTKNAIICTNKPDLIAARKVLNIPQNKLNLIYSGIDTKADNFLEKTAALEALKNLLGDRLAINKSTILIGSIGNLYPAKGFGDFIQAFEIVKIALQIQIKNTINIKAIIIGEGEEREKLEDMIRQKNLQDDIILAGSMQNASVLLKAFDIYACSSVKEGLPYSILEAGLAGLAVTSTNVGGASDIIQGDVNGLLVEAGKPDELARSIKELIDDPKKRIKFGEALKINIQENFKIENMLTETNEVYEALL
ncbi:glycosyltransferase [Patescibacteria group bacterium]|nr:glycosyltransferase [Patescibacteria group bacterium]